MGQILFIKGDVLYVGVHWDSGVHRCAGRHAALPLSTPLIPPHKRDKTKTKTIRVTELNVGLRCVVLRFDTVESSKYIPAAPKPY